MCNSNCWLHNHNQAAILQMFLILVFIHLFIYFSFLCLFSFLFFLHFQAELYTLIKQHRPPPFYETDRLAQMHGHVILRSPVRHCELNAIELIWAQVKGYVAERNTTYKIADVQRLYEEALKVVSIYSNCNF